MDIRNTIKDILSSTVKTDIVGVGAGKELLTLIGDKAKLPYVGSIIDNIKKLHDRPTGGLTVNQIYQSGYVSTGRHTISEFLDIVKASNAPLLLIYNNDNVDSGVYASSMIERDLFIELCESEGDPAIFTVGGQNATVSDGVLTLRVIEDNSRLTIKEVK